jgi:hypothetical protein
MIISIFATLIFNSRTCYNIFFRIRYMFVIKKDLFVVNLSWMEALEQ